MYLRVTTLQCQAIISYGSLCPPYMGRKLADILVELPLQIHYVRDAGGTTVTAPLMGETAPNNRGPIRG